MLRIFLPVLFIAGWSALAKPLATAEMAVPECIVPVLVGEGAEILARAQVTVVGSPPGEELRIASAVKTITNRMGLDFQQRFAALKILVLDQVWGSLNKKGVRARLGGQQIDSHTFEYSREVLDDPLMGVAYMVHEFGHPLGNAGFYQRYNRFVKTICEISVYATHRVGPGFEGIAHKTRNEEFAEAFSAYMIAPQALFETCPTAYQFFEKTMGFAHNRQQKVPTRMSYPYTQLNACEYPANF